MSQMQTSLRMAAIVLGCALAGALLTAGPASAASRGFVLHNNSRHFSLQLEYVHPVPCVLNFCTRAGVHHYPIDFEGRPAAGSVLQPGHVHRWELKYSFSISGGVQYAADIRYSIGTSATHDLGYVDYLIEVYSRENESSCRIISPADSFPRDRKVGRCTAGGTNLTYSTPTIDDRPGGWRN